MVSWTVMVCVAEELFQHRRWPEGANDHVVARCVASDGLARHFNRHSPQLSDAVASSIGII